MVSEQRVYEILAAVLGQLGDSALPGGLNAIPGLDPNYKTHPLREAHTVPTDESSSDGESEFAINAGETKHFRYVMNNKTPSGVYGVSISTPPGIRDDSAAIITQVINGTTRARALSVGADFNHSVGRFNTGTLLVEGQIENGPTPGMVRIAYGAPESEADLNLTGHIDQAAAIITGDDTITIPKAGRYVVTWLVEETLPT